MSSVSSQNEAVDFDYLVKVALTATTFLVYDTLIHVGDEVEYIWKARCSWIKWAYVMVRHWPYFMQGANLALTISSITGRSWLPGQCRGWHIYQVIAIEGLTIIVQAILIVNIHAMFSQNKFLLVVILLLFAGEIAAMIILWTLSIMSVKFTSQCLITNSRSVYAVWIPSLIFGTTLFVLILVKFFTSMNRHLGRRSVLFILVRDGTWAYGVITAVMLTSMLMCRVLDNPLSGIGYYCELSAVSYAGSHMLLNLRRFASGDDEIEDTCYSSESNLLFELPAIVDLGP